MARAFPVLTRARMMNSSSAPWRTRYMRQHEHGRAGVLLVAAVAVVVAVYLAAGYVAAPTLIARAIGPYATVDHIRTDPLRLRADLSGVSVSEPGNISTALLSLDFSLMSLFFGRPIIDELTIEAPRAAIAFPRVQGDGPWPGELAAAVEELTRNSRIERLTIEDGELELYERSGAGNPYAAFTSITLEATRLDARDAAPGLVRLSAREAGGASLALEGTMLLSEMRLEGAVMMTDLDLLRLGPWLDPLLAAARPEGTADLSAEYVLDARAGGTVLEINDGQVELTGLRLTPQGSVGLSASSLVLDLSAAIEQNDGVYGLEGRLAVPTGNIDIADGRHRRAATWSLRDIAAELAFSRRRPTAALDMELNGNLVGGGTAKLTAAMAVEADSVAESFDLVLEDVPAAQLAVYAERVLGREPVGGTIDLELVDTDPGPRVDGHLRIATHGLALDNDTMLGRGLRIDLVKALLEGARGDAMIDASVVGVPRPARPVSELFAAALRRRIVGIAAAPLDALAAIAGTEASALRGVSFAPGDASLSPAAQQTVEMLGRALRERPRLGLHIPGVFDAMLDRHALAQQQIELHVLLATAGPQLQARPEPIDFASPRAQDVLDEFAAERLPAEQRAELAALFEFDPASNVAPAERGPYYEAVFDALVASETIASAALERLGRFRVQSITDLLEALGVGAQRVTAERRDLNVGRAVSAVELPVEPRPLLDAAAD